MTRQEIERQIAELQKKLAEMPVKWEPKGGDYFVNECGEVDNIVSCTQGNTSFGNEYSTFKQAEKAAKAMRAHNRLLAYVAEFAPDYEFKSGRKNDFVYYDGTKWRADYSCWMIAGAVFMPESVAIELAAKLNSGEVEL